MNLWGKQHLLKGTGEGLTAPEIGKQSGMCPKKTNLSQINRQNVIIP